MGEPYARESYAIEPYAGESYAQIANALPSGENFNREPCAWKCLTFRPLLTSQSIIVRSTHAAASIRESGENVKLQIR